MEKEQDSSLSSTKTTTTPTTMSSSNSSGGSERRVGRTPSTPKSPSSQPKTPTTPGGTVIFKVKLTLDKKEVAAIVKTEPLSSSSSSSSTTTTSGGKRKPKYETKRSAATGWKKVKIETNRPKIDGPPVATALAPPLPNNAASGVMTL
jgi:hypothetical protein